MPQYCCVPNCNNRVGGHRFPREVTLHEKWLEVVSRPCWAPKKNDVVCCKHFTVDDYRPAGLLNERKILKVNAVPSVFNRIKTAKRSRINQQMKTNHLRMEDIIGPNAKPVPCMGCQIALQPGIIPDDLIIPVPGINVWTIAKAYSGISSHRSSANQFGKNLTLCLECFNGYATGKKDLSLKILGISVVTAAYSEENKYLKIEGPTKLVNLLTEQTSCEGANIVKPGYLNDFSYKASDPEIPTRQMRKRKQDIMPKEDLVETENEMSDSKPNTVNYLSIGTGSLGAVEMTDDDC